MDQLPQEIIDDIITHRFDYSKDKINTYRHELHPFSRFVTVSRKFQYAIERLLFRTIKITNRENDIQMFDSLFSRNHYRRDFLKHVTLHIDIDDYLENTNNPAITALDMDRARSGVFEAISEMFLILSVWTDRQAIRLTISFQGEGAPGDQSLFFRHRIRENLVINPLELDTLPAAPCIRSLDTTCPSSSEIFDKYEHSDSSKTAFWLPTHKLAKVYINPPLCFELVQLLDFVTSEYHADFCATMHNLLNNFAQLDYRGILEPAFFWPYGVSDEPAPFWQKMTHMRLQFEPANLSGEWYFKAGPQLQYRPWFTQFRRTPEEGIIMPLIQAMCMALDQMPNLKSFQMWCDVTQMKFGEYWRIVYLAPGVPSEFDGHVVIPSKRYRVPGGGERAGDHDPGLGTGNDDGAESRRGGAEMSKSSQSTDYSSLDRVRTFPRWMLDVGEWQPSAKVLKALRRVGRGIHGQDALISFIPLNVTVW